MAIFRYHKSTERVIPMIWYTLDPDEKQDRKTGFFNLPKLYEFLWNETKGIEPGAIHTNKEVASNLQKVEVMQMPEPASSMK